MGESRLVHRVQPASRRRHPAPPHVPRRGRGRGSGCDCGGDCGGGRDSGKGCSGCGCGCGYGGGSGGRRWHRALLGEDLGKGGGRAQLHPNKEGSGWALGRQLAAAAAAARTRRGAATAAAAAATAGAAIFI
eukprot:scaffold36873_cov78-Phaeocystis_antarctica.AAC.10